jgi:hypothetical protein
MSEPSVVVIVVSCGHGPLKELLVPLFVALDAIPATEDGDVGRRSLPAAQGRLPIYLGQVYYDCLIAGGVLGGDTARCLDYVPAKVAMLTLEQAPCAALGLHAHAPMVGLGVGLWLDMSALPPRRGLG